MSDTATATRERPLIFSAPMVRALLESRKHQTRRLLKPQPTNPPFSAKFEDDGYVWWELNSRDNWHRGNRCPYGAPGSLLWVREAWGLYRPAGCEEQAYRRRPIPADAPEEICVGDADLNRRDYGDRLRVVYRADGEIEGMRWRSPMFMPRWASRITLAIESVRAERLADISEEDAKAEGAGDEMDPDDSIQQDSGGNVVYYPTHNHRFGFRNLWDSLNGSKPGRAWADNPWVWALSFRVEVANA